jgi:hypothetical protein
MVIHWKRWLATEIHLDQTPSYLQTCLSQSDTKHQYVFSLNDKLDSFLGRFHFDYHNLILFLVAPTKYIDIIFVTIFLLCLYEWLPCINLF